MKRLFVLFAVLALPRAYGQERFAEVSFDSYTYDFGTVEETGGKISHTFTFTNKGKIPFVITSVSVSCGCTQPEFSKEPVRPGGSGTFKVTYDPENRPGPFRKPVYIICNTEEKSVTLTIEGKVKGRPRSIEEDFPFEMSGGLRVASLGSAVGAIPRGKVSRHSIGVANAGGEPLQLDVESENLQSFVKIAPKKSVLQPGERSEIEITVDGTQTDKWGLERIAFFPVVNSEKVENPITVSVIFAENITDLTPEQVRNGPKAEFSSYFYHFSQQKRGTVLTRVFDFKNTGGSDLIIRYLDTTSSRITASSSKTVVRPGEEATVTVRLDTSDAPSGRLSESVLVLSNDPHKPSREIRVMATVTQ